ncbi:hypothetical protein [uncultured Desulfosarcina sp.]|uniref:hypothetical protein n=1 Tax=uncultured Desulfosarcina sp. TaxID=218289 RepID=UPI0029C7D1E8|nr:hypothetical protein [uncultured Desulfosarcina sp.]
MAEQVSASRDDIVELSIQRLLPVFKKEHRRQNNRERAFAKIKEHLIQGKPLMDEIRQLVGEDDSRFRSFQSVTLSFAKTFAEIETLVDHGKRIYILPIEFIKRDN